METRTTPWIIARLACHARSYRIEFHIAGGRPTDDARPKHTNRIDPEKDTRLHLPKNSSSWCIVGAPSPPHAPIPSHRLGLRSNGFDSSSNTKLKPRLPKRFNSSGSSPVDFYTDDFDCIIHLGFPCSKMPNGSAGEPWPTGPSVPSADPFTGPPRSKEVLPS